MKPIELAIAKTLAYSDIFDYPLTAAELHRFLISPRKTAKKNLPRQQYYYLPGRKNLISLRKKRYRFSQLKLKQIQPLVNLLKIIPSIRLVAVTGALAMNNADEFDDIDLMIITKANRLWLTRLITLLILEISGSRRRFGQVIINNKICPNLWLDETTLTIPPHLRNLYTAHEIAQIKPLFDRFETYQQFVSANLWVKHYLANWSV